MESELHAVEAAYLDGIREAWGVLVINLITNELEPSVKFERAIANLRRARVIALEVVRQNAR